MGYFVKKLPNEKGIKLFLCSENIQVGDEVTFEDGTKRKIKSIVGGFPKVEGEDNFEARFKIIEEISENALWVKEGDTFNEEEIKRNV